MALRVEDAFAQSDWWHNRTMSKTRNSEFQHPLLHKRALQLLLFMLLILLQVYTKSAWRSQAVWTDATATHLRTKWHGHLTISSLAQHLQVHHAPTHHSQWPEYMGNSYWPRPGATGMTSLHFVQSVCGQIQFSTDFGLLFPKFGDDFWSSYETVHLVCDTHQSPAGFSFTVSFDHLP